MQFPINTINHTSVFLLFGLSFVVFGCFLFILSISGLFFLPAILIGAILCGIITVLTGIQWLRFAHRDLHIAVIGIALFSIFIGMTTDPTIFSGRDQGSLSEAAWRLSTNGTLAFSQPASDRFFEIHGPGIALNFPGFAYTGTGQLITQFPLGYIAWLAGFVSLFGLSGFTIGNTLLLFLFLSTLYQLIRQYSASFYAFTGVLLTASSFLPIWFSKITLSENLAVFLFTFLVFNIMLVWQTNNRLAYYTALLTVILLAFTRIEGFAFLMMTIIVFASHKPTRQLWKTHPLTQIILPGSLFTLFFLQDFLVNLPYYTMIGKALIKFLATLNINGIESNLSPTFTSFTLGSIFFLYGLLIMFLFGSFGILFFLKEKKYLLLIPTLIALPTFLYFFNPNISSDHPWMLRRYLFSLFPTLLFSAIMGIALLLDKKKTLPIVAPHGKRLLVASLIFSGCFILQYPAWKISIFSPDNDTLFAQIKTFSQDFLNTDLVLVDRRVTGDGFTMLTGPMQFLFDKQMVYFFNPTDLEHLDTTTFSHVYLLVPENGQEYYTAVFGPRLTLQKTVVFSLKQLEISPFKNTFFLSPPHITNTSTTNLLFKIDTLP